MSQFQVSSQTVKQDVFDLDLGRPESHETVKMAHIHTERAFVM